MNELLFVMNSINNNPMITFVIIVVIGCVWIYFQTPNIKKKNTPSDGVASTKDEWVDAHQAMNKYSLILVSFGLIFVYLIWEYAPNGENLFLNAMVAICFLTAAIMQLMNKVASNMYINK